MPHPDRKRRDVLIATMFVAAGTSLFAHDFWIASSISRPTPGATVTITANVGDYTYPVSDSATAADRIDSLRLVGPATSLLTPVYRIAGNSLATDVRLPSAPATYMAVMTVKGRFLTMEAKEFLDYLKEEGLDAVIADRERRGESGTPSRERYSRQAKTLIRAGDGPSIHVTRPVGLVAELVPESDFAQARVGDRVAVRLLFEGRSVAGAQISAYAAGPGEIRTRRQVVRTDANGRAEILLKGNGPFLLTTTHMARRSGETGPEAADWESYWVSITFDPRR